MVAAVVVVVCWAEVESCGGDLFVRSVGGSVGRWLVVGLAGGWMGMGWVGAVLVAVAVAVAVHIVLDSLGRPSGDAFVELPNQQAERYVYPLSLTLLLPCVGFSLTPTH